MKYILILLLSCFFFELTYVSALEEFSAYDLALIVCLLAVVLGLEVLIAHLFARSRIVQNLILAGFATTNIFYVNLVLNGGFISLPRYGQIIALLLALFILFTFMNMLDESTRISLLLPAFFALAVAAVLAQILLSFTTVPELSAEHEKVSAKNIRLVDFETRPNVYFIGFDSILPKVLLQKHLGMETTPYHEVLDSHFRPFRNFFADHPSTRPSLNSLLALDVEYFSEATRNNTKYSFFSGLVPSPLFEIFKHNGYETTTLYRRPYFGREKGPYVDNYRLGSTKFSVCEFINATGYRTPTFAGYCKLVKSEMFRSFLMRLGVSDQGNQIDFLIEHMRAGLKKKIPQIVVGYIYSPGHTDQTFDKKDSGALDEYRKAYLTSSETTAAYLNKIVAFIAKEDPEAIVYIFGDHGPWLSRQDSFEKEGAFYVQDRFGVYGGIHPRDRCAHSFANPYNKEFMTVLQGAHMIIRCLSGGKNAFHTLDDYHLPEIGTNVNSRYEDYLYE